MLSSGARKGEPLQTGIETPSGKGAGDENFPVGSWLLPARLRPHVAAFYRFARGADDIADNPLLSPEDKIARLDRLADAVAGRNVADPDAAIALRMRESLAATGVGVRHCLDILDAFRQDALKARYDDWDDLMHYCARSANPVGRYLLDLHGEDRAAYAASDPLCSALQVINHLQDAKDDYARLDRVYLPEDWLRAEGADVTELGADALSPALRRVFDRCLEGVAQLLQLARPLSRSLNSSRLAMESAAIVALADGLTAALQAHDPLARRVEHSRPAFLARAGFGVVGALSARILRPAHRTAQTAPGRQ